MDAETKAILDRLQEQAQKQSQENTTTSRPLWQRPSKEDQEKRIRELIDKRIDGCMPRMFLLSDINNCDVVLRGFDSVFITGPAGTGKSYMASAMLKEEMRTSFWKQLQEIYKEKEEFGPDIQKPIEFPSFVWVSIPELLLSLRSSFRDKSDYSEEEIIDDHSRVRYLILDDFGAEKSSEFAIQSLYLIIDRRYSNMRPTIITSNLSLGQLSEKVGDRIASRIAGMCKVIELKGKDRRLSK